MKIYILALTLFFISTNLSFGVEKIYLQEQCPHALHRRYYNPYANPYYSPYRYRKTNYNNAKRLQRIQKIRLLNQIRNNFLTWNNFNRGSLTGYSTPISPSVYSHLGINPWNNIKYNQKTPNVTTELFSSPTTTRTYYSNGRIIDYTDGISNKTGVTIIYD